MESQQQQNSQTTGEYSRLVSLCLGQGLPFATALGGACGGLSFAGVAALIQTYLGDTTHPTHTILFGAGGTALTVLARLIGTACRRDDQPSQEGNQVPNTVVGRSSESSAAVGDLPSV